MTLSKNRSFYFQEHRANPGIPHSCQSPNCDPCQGAFFSSLSLSFPSLTYARMVPDRKSHTFQSCTRSPRRRNEGSVSHPCRSRRENRAVFVFAMGRFRSVIFRFSFSLLIRFFAQISRFFLRLISSHTKPRREESGTEGRGSIIATQ